MPILGDQQVQVNIKVNSDTGGVDSASSSLEGFGGTLQNIGTIAAGIGLERIAEGIINVGKQAAMFAVDYASNLEQARIAYDAFTGSAQAGGQALKEVTDFARKTPFQLPEVVTAGQQLLGFGFSVKDLLPKLNEVGSLAIATHKPMSVAIDLFARAREGMFNLREYGQFGISREALEKFGVSFTKAGAAVNKSELLPALEKLIKARFGDVLQKEATTLGGVVSNIKDDIGRMASVFIGLDPETADIVKGGIFESIRNFATNLYNWIESHQATIKEWAKTFQTAIMNIVGFVGSGFKTVVGLLQGHSGEIKFILTELGSIFQKTWDVIKSISQLFMDTIGKYIKDHWDYIAGTVKFALTLIGGIIKIALDLISGFFKVFDDLLRGNWGKLWNDIKNVVVNIVKDVTGIVRGFFDWIGSAVNDAIKNILHVGSTSKSITKRATGGFASGLTLVGENGPELLSVPNGSYVYNNNQTNQMIGQKGSGGVTINQRNNIYNQVDFDALNREMAWRLRLVTVS